MSKNKELSDWVSRYPESEMTYYCVAINGCGAIALMNTGGTTEAFRDAMIYALFALEE